MASLDWFERMKTTGRARADQLREQTWDVLRGETALLASAEILAERHAGSADHATQLTGLLLLLGLSSLLDGV